MSKSKKLIYTFSVMTALLLFGLCSSILGIAQPQTTEQLVENSSDVVRGIVISQKSQWDESHTVIYTEVLIEITDVMVGSIEENRTISVYVPGGVVNDTGLAVEHAPEFANGEDVIVFLTELDKLYSVTSWEMGKFTVENGNVREKNLPVADYIKDIKSNKR